MSAKSLLIFCMVVPFCFCKRRTAGDVKSSEASGCYGVNSNNCSSRISGSSSWETSYDLEDGSKFTIRWEFKEISPSVGQYVQSIIQPSAKGDMVQQIEGNVQVVSSNLLRLIPRSSTCMSGNISSEHALRSAGLAPLFKIPVINEQFLYS